MKLQALSGLRTMFVCPQPTQSWQRPPVFPDSPQAQPPRYITSVTPVGFEPTQLALVELESTPLDHSGKVSCELVWPCAIQPLKSEEIGCSRHGMAPSEERYVDAVVEQNSHIPAELGRQCSWLRQERQDSQLVSMLTCGPQPSKPIQN